MNLQITKAGLLALGTMFLLNIIAFIQPGFISAIFASLCTAVILVSFISACFSLRAISISREAHNDGQADSIVILPLRIHNLMKRKRQHLFIRERLSFQHMKRN